LGLLPTIILEIVPFRAYASFPAFIQFFKCIPEVVYCECSAPPAILPPSPQLCQDGGFSVLSSTGKAEESHGGSS
jgi:hypothetical protein